MGPLVSIGADNPRVALIERHGHHVPQGSYDVLVDEIPAGAILTPWREGHPQRRGWYAFTTDGGYLGSFASHLAALGHLVECHDDRMAELAELAELEL